MSVVAVCVTYNRRELVASCLQAVFAQTAPVACVVLVDNASTDGTEEFLRERELLGGSVRYVRLERNEGSAGGYAAGVAAARAIDADWLWLMDDDSAPAPDTLELLLASPAASDAGVAALCSAVVRADGSVDAGHRGHFRGRARPLALDAYMPGTAPALDFFTFVGVLVRMSVARATDPPMAELFIWADDYEYSWRVRGHGTIRLVPESRMLHLDVGQAHSNRRSRFWNRLLGWSFVPTPIDGFWRNLCGVRNFVWIKKRYEGQGPAGAALLIAQFALKSLLYDEAPLRRLKWIVRFGIDGRRGRFRTIRPEAWRELVARGRV